jgi:phosphate transport system substrate-binding protein
MEERQLAIRGSDTMLVLNRRLAEAYMRAHPGVSVRVEGGGTAAGVAALVDGEADICAASRPLLAEEVAAIYDRHATLGVRFLIAQDALSVFVNAANPIRSLELSELRGLFDGSIASWRDVGGDDVAVVPIVRPPSSGSHRFFRDHVLKGGPYAAGAITAATTNDVLASVRTDAGGVGYGGVAYRLEGVAAIAVDGVPPAAEAVRDGRYPLARYLAFSTVRPPTGLARRFIDWCLGPEGQAVVAEVGYVPLWDRRQPV